MTDHHLVGTFEDTEPIVLPKNPFSPPITDYERTHTTVNEALAEQAILLSTLGYKATQNDESEFSPPDSAVFTFGNPPSWVENSFWFAFNDHGNDWADAGPPNIPTPRPTNLVVHPEETVGGDPVRRHTRLAHTLQRARHIVRRRVRRRHNDLRTA